MDVAHVEGKIVAQHQTGFVTKESRTPKRARGTFVPPYDRQTPRRSPRLRKKRFDDEQDSRIQPGSTVTTPVRAALKKSVSATPVDVLESVMRISADPAYSHLKGTQTKAVSNNKLTDYAIVTRSTMIDDECIGPHDAVRLFFSEDRRYKLMVYENVVKEGTAVDDSEMHDLLAEMNDDSMVVCQGITDYQQYRSSIGYDINRVKLCSWPPNTARDIECAFWHKKCTLTSSGMCNRCSRLNWQLAARKKTHDELTPLERERRRSASSAYPFQYLSPKSKKVKIENLQQAVTYHQRLSHKAQAIDRACISEVQGAEVAEIIHTIHSCAEGQKQLQQIYAEADQTGDGRGAVLKQMWEEDVSDMEQFRKDQESNGKYMFVYTYLIMFYHNSGTHTCTYTTCYSSVCLFLFYLATGRRTNKWSAVTIRLGMFQILYC